MSRERNSSGSLARRCKGCGELIYEGEIKENLQVCPRCGYHYRLPPDQRLQMLLDDGIYEEQDAEIITADPLKFKDIITYRERLKKIRKSTGSSEAMITGIGKLGDLDVIVSAMNFFFLGGSMGSVVGEKLVLAAERAMQMRIPLISIIATGGARMQEGMVSLSQMPKTAAAVTRLKNAGLPYITILTNPSMAGVLASFASLADIIIAEPGALIGFTGPRVIEQTTGQKLPDHAQVAESVLEYGMIDMICHRKDLRSTLIRLLELILS